MSELLLLCVAAVPQQVGSAKDPVVVRAIGDPRDATMSRWRRLQQLRRDLELPEKRITDSSAPAARRLQLRAMNFVRDGLRVQLAALPRPQELGSEEAVRMLARTRQEFERAAQAHAVGARAVLAVAHEIAAPWIAERALGALPSEQLSMPGTAIEGGLLRDLLAHPGVTVRAQAWRHLLWFCDSQGAGDVIADMIARGRRRLRLATGQLEPGHWDGNERMLPASRNVLPFRLPKQLAAAELVFAALDGDREVLDQLLKRDLDARLLMMAHVLAAPRVDAAYAGRLFGWYSQYPPKWKEVERGLTQWEFGVVAILVGVLPKLGKADADDCLCMLSGGHFGAAAMAAARHRLHRLGPIAASVPWLPIDELPVADLRGADALHLWRSLGGSKRLSVADCLELAPVTSERRTRREFVLTVLRRAPLQRWDFELDLARRWVADQDGAVARAALRRCARVAAGKPKAMAGLMCRAAPWCALEFAIEHREHVPLRVDRLAVPVLSELHQMILADRQRPLTRMVGKLLADGSGSQLRAGLFGSRLLSRWTSELLRQVARRTTDADPEVRRAAYLALLGRPNEERKARLLGSEAMFDPSPDVRALVPDN